MDDARRGVEEAAPAATVLVDELVRTVEAGGKRIRPLFCYWGYRAGGGADAAAVARAGAAVELLHTAAIVHDDVIDESLVRRRRPSAFSALGRAGAILAGDLAQALADQALAASDLPPRRVATAFGPFNEMRILAIAGELLDVAAAGAPAGAAEPDERAVRRAGALKSGSYTVVGPLRVGAELAGAGPEVMAWLDAYGHPLGEAFQIRDDVLGTFGVPVEADVRIALEGLADLVALRDG